MEHTQGSYYVPEQSKLPLLTAFAMFLTVFGIAHWLNGSANGPMIFAAGFLAMAIAMWLWFGAVIRENLAGLNSAQLKRSYVWGMGWFIFSEFMFFAAFFGAMHYIRTFTLTDLSDGETSRLIWNGFQAEWPLMITPDMVINGEEARHVGPGRSMSNPGLLSWFTWLPFWNTLILLTSSFTIHFAHTALNKNNKKRFNQFLGATVILGVLFLMLQAWEYYEAYAHYGLTLASGIYGATFFILTGFHGLHVTMGTFILAVMWARSAFKGHFKHGDAFGFEAASWYWHFVDVVWLGLFIFVYVLS